MNAKLLACISLAIAILILLHQYIVYGELFTLSQLHHETFAAAFTCLAIGILIGSKHHGRYRRIKPKRR